MRAGHLADCGTKKRSHRHRCESRRRISPDTSRSDARHAVRMATAMRRYRRRTCEPRARVAFVQQARLTSMTARLWRMPPPASPMSLAKAFCQPARFFRKNCAYAATCFAPFDFASVKSSRSSEFSSRPSAPGHARCSCRPVPRAAIVVPGPDLGARRGFAPPASAAARSFDETSGLRRTGHVFSYVRRRQRESVRYRRPAGGRSSSRFCTRPSAWPMKPVDRNPAVATTSASPLASMVEGFARISSRTFSGHARLRLHAPRSISAPVAVRY